MTAIAAKDFVRVNGFSNDYWGWGSEDDDFSRRMSHRNMTLVRSTDLDPSAIEYSTYRTLYHPKEKENADRGEVFHRKAVPHEMLTDGLFNLLSFIQRKTVATTLYYTHVSVEFDSKKVNRQYPI